MLVELIGGDRGEVDAERKDVGTVLRRLKVEAAREEAHLMKEAIRRHQRQLEAAREEARLMKEAIRRNERPSVVTIGNQWPFGSTQWKFGSNQWPSVAIS